MFMVAIGVHILHVKERERVEEIKKRFAQEISEPRIVPWRDAVVTIYPDGNFVVNGRDSTHCRVIHDEVMESFKRRYM